MLAASTGPLKANDAVTAADPSLSFKHGKSAIYRFPRKAQLLGDKSPRTVQQYAWRIAIGTQAQPREHSLFCGADVAQFKLGPQVPYLRCKSEGEGHAPCWIGGHEGEQIGFRQNEHDRGCLGDGIAMIVRC